MVHSEGQRALEAAWIKKYASSWDGGEGQVSCFAAALRDARGASLRDLATGQPMPNHLDDHSTSWLGAVGYMIVLDQLGSTVRPRTLPCTHADGRAFLRALEHFAEQLDDDDRSALYALRCGFMHDYSLTHPRGKPHRFTLVADDVMPLVVHADHPWNGQFLPSQSEHDATTTIVNLRAFATLVEAIAGRVEDLAERESLSLALDGGITELVTRFFFGHRKD